MKKPTLDAKTTQQEAEAIMARVNKLFQSSPISDVRALQREYKFTTMLLEDLMDIHMQLKRALNEAVDDRNQND